MNPSSLYIHWPFCPYRCSFCPFVALAGHEQYMERYHYGLTAEIKQFVKEPGNLLIDTLYFGGGTPSTYPLPLLLDMSGTLRKVVRFTDDAEITLEANPGTVRKEHIEVWKRVGINRVSIGVQSLKESTLKTLNRFQKTEDVLQVLDMVHANFKTVSIDLIIGLPGIRGDEWKRTIMQVVQWPIQHCSIYFLMVHESTPLYFSVQKKTIELPADDQIVDLYYWTIEYLASSGFQQYELSSFAKPGHESKHNRAYWHRKPFKGFGLGAWSFDGSARTQNEKNLMAYLQGVENDRDVITFKEMLSEKQIWLEKIMLGLRQMNGITQQELLQHLTDEEQKIINERIALLEQRELLVRTETQIKLAHKAFALEHEVIRLLTVS